MSLKPNGMYETRVEGIGPGALYGFKIDGTGPFPDPASRFQPRGVHGPSQVLGASEFSWADDNFLAPPLRDLSIYELHIGAFTPEGTFRGAIGKLDALRELGVNVVEIMPIAEFPGQRNWGYDGVSPYAPTHNYGAPDDLRALVREAHRRGIAVCLDVVYNHLGPDGAYHSTFAPQFYSAKHKTPWGDGLNYDSEGREKVRAYFIESALAWIRDYHIDGLRADAIDTIQDDSNPSFLAELTERLHSLGRELGREVFLIAEDARNQRKVVLPPEQGGLGFDVVWADDFHHHIRHRLAGDNEGYYCDFDGTAEHIAETVRKGWFFTGQFAQYWGRERGTSPQGLSPQSRLFCIQNHDQIGNRAFGERLSTQISLPTYFAASALLLLSPEIPMLFMGQEWAAPEPFLYFTDHNREVGRLVTEGRRREFEHFAGFTDETRRDRIPDPQAEDTFLHSKLDWARRQAPEHAACLNWYQALFQIRKKLLQTATFHSSRALNDKIVLVEWQSSGGSLSFVAALEGPAEASDAAWQNRKLILSSEDALPAAMRRPASWNAAARGLEFQQPGAVLLASGDLNLLQESRPNDR